MHSPFVYELIDKVFRDGLHYADYDRVENIRESLVLSGETLNVSDLGAGSLFFPTGKRKVKQMVRHSSCRLAEGRLLYRLVRYFGCKNIIETGTSLGIGAMYMAAASKDGTVYTIEGCSEQCSLAFKNFRNGGFDNIRLIEGTFEDTLPGLLDSLGRVDFVFFDGSHSKDSVLWQFRECLKRSTFESIFVFDDIHWSDDMEKAWEEISADPSVRVTVDIFRMGLVFFRKELSRQRFVLNF